MSYVKRLRYDSSPVIKNVPIKGSTWSIGIKGKVYSYFGLRLFNSIKRNCVCWSRK